MKTLKSLLGACAVLITVLVPLVFLLKAMDLIYPIPTLVTVAIFTAIAFRQVSTGCISVLGIIFYTYGWAMHAKWHETTIDQIIANGTCAFGIGMWFWAVGSSLKLLWTERTARGRMIES